MQVKIEVPVDERDRETLTEIIQALATMFARNWSAIRPIEEAQTTVNFAAILGSENKHLVAITSGTRRFKDGRIESIEPITSSDLHNQRREHLIAAAEITVKLAQWDYWLAQCVEAWDVAAADNSDLELTISGAMDQLRGIEWGNWQKELDDLS